MTEQIPIPQAQQTQPTPTTQANLSWLDDEEKAIEGTQQFKGEKLPSLKLESGKVTKFIVDLTFPFGSWTGTQSGKEVTKAIIPVTHKGEKKLLWLTKKNPLYKDIVHKCKEGKTEFQVSTTGSQAETRYTLVEND